MEKPEARYKELESERIQFAAEPASHAVETSPAISSIDDSRSSADGRRVSFKGAVGSVLNGLH